MKKIFSKTINIFIITAVIFAVSGFCPGMWSENIIYSASAATINNHDNIMVAVDNCSDINDNQSPVSDLGTPSFAVTTQPMQNSNDMMTCCLEASSRVNNSTIAHQIYFSNFFTIISPLKEMFAVVNSLALPSLPILLPPEQLALSTSNMRI